MIAARARLENSLRALNNTTLHLERRQGFKSRSIYGVWFLGVLV